ncbi:MAG: ATP-binding protein, partial [Eggerthellaceae bacterium]|nr:ATP-binding protein [Eggerthellaceae bacterium]
LEFKQEFTPQFLKTVSAFANYDGGNIIFGITDSGQIVGIDDPENDCLKIENSINDSLDPVPRFTLDNDSETATITLVVYPGELTPYLYRGKAYKRSSTSTVEVDRYEYGKLVLKGLNTTFDALESSEQDLTFNSLEKAFVDKIGLESLDRNVLITLELLNA